MSEIVIMAVIVLLFVASARHAHEVKKLELRIEDQQWQIKDLEWDNIILKRAEQNRKDQTNEQEAN